MLHDNDMGRLRDDWVIEAVPAGLADRITRHALAQAQHRPFMKRVKDALAVPMHTNTAWKGGFAIAACLLIAVVVMDSGSAAQASYKKPMTQLVEEMYFTY